MPDHRDGKLILKSELLKVVDILNDLTKNGSVFVHCFACVERSPLVCMAWLVKYKSFSKLESLEYVMQINPGTNPLPGQLNILDYL